MNKTEYITALLSIEPDMPVDRIVHKAGCTRQMVNYVKRNMVEPKPKASTSTLAEVAGCTRQMVNRVKRDMAAKDSIVGFFTDTHEPACHPRFFEFVRDTFRAHGVTEVVCGGDLIDHHFISRHTTEPDAMNPIDELELAIKNLEKWGKEFPVVKVCTGNHDAIPTRQAKELGIPERYLRSLNDVYGLPEGWTWAPQHEIDGVMYEHGLGAGGMYGYKNLALAYRQSVCVGHTHSYGGVLYIASNKDIIFGLNGGCGMDVKSYAARYGSNFKFKPTLGCGIIKNGKEAMFVPMDMETYRR